jgi:DNA-binding transcriptional regulator YdaS (Cro superfamily)
MEGKELKRLLRMGGIKQTWLADKLGVKKAQVNQWVNEVCTIPDKYVIEIKNLLRVAA